MIKITKDFLRPFSTAEVMQLQTLAMEMETYGVTAVDVLAMCREYFEGMRPKHAAPGQTPQPEVCPECGSGLSEKPVNVSPCTNIGGGWRSVLICQNDLCLYTELSSKFIKGRP
jgi:hypothetical protein